MQKKLKWTFFKIFFNLRKRLRGNFFHFFFMELFFNNTKILNCLKYEISKNIHYHGNINDGTDTLVPTYSHKNFNTFFSNTGILVRQPLPENSASIVQLVNWAQGRTMGCRDRRRVVKSAWFSLVTLAVVHSFERIARACVFIRVRLIVLYVPVDISEFSIQYIIAVQKTTAVTLRHDIEFEFHLLTANYKVLVIIII
ncbi:hypothetical protein AGLY_012709 [Aphis glycines]|uniref:Uncharacterized protein n=1 Tax=Aphis glycines TaxID=307491 RepID=A0A6G0T903_APHGL|nr:hypothetical protein AGLY_012709 [Aphis glycines]